MSNNLIASADVTRVEWDAVVVGSGMGGATVGYALARAGKRVLFCERGKSHYTAQGLAASAVVGDYPEQCVGHRGNTLASDSRELLYRAGRFADDITDSSGSRRRTFLPYLGSGAGGSTALYGMALERFFPSDFTHALADAGAAKGSADRNWPIDFDSMSPFYDAAETLYRVRGTPDPLRGAQHATSVAPPPPLTDVASSLFKFFESKGLHPYRLPMACDFVPGCKSCQGYLCLLACKNDSARICLQPAVNEYGAVLLDECNVIRVDSDRSKVKGVICQWRGEELRIKADIVILAAGALQTPRLLLNSSSAEWPDGLANRSGMVGRCLMRHFVDLYVVTPDVAATDGTLENRFKEIAFNDFYAAGNVKLGSVQSFGRLPPSEMLFASMRHDLRSGALPWVASVLPLAKPFLTPYLNNLVDRSIVFASTIEDLPYGENRVELAKDSGVAGGTVNIRYAITPEARERIKMMRMLMRKTFTPLHWRLVAQAENNERIAHACGTCRFGDDPRTSVLNAENQAHDVRNLFIVDSSFFPSSGGTNPSLTIAANALRVAALLASGAAI